VHLHESKYQHALVKRERRAHTVVLSKDWRQAEGGLLLQAACQPIKHALHTDARRLCRCVREADFRQEATWLPSSHPHKCGERVVACVPHRKLAFASVCHAVLGGPSCPASRTTTAASNKVCTSMALQQPLHMPAQRPHNADLVVFLFQGLEQTYLLLFLTGAALTEASRRASLPLQPWHWSASQCPVHPCCTLLRCRLFVKGAPGPSAASMLIMIRRCSVTRARAARPSSAARHWRVDRSEDLVDGHVDELRLPGFPRAPLPLLEPVTKLSLPTDVIRIVTTPCLT
jgi:hypothetical protein